jgi:tetratricopeptide (TPR) repeat protein
LVEHPRDALALRYASDLYYYFGDARGIRDSAGRALRSWNQADPLYGFVLARHAFGLEESGALDEAQASAERALALHPEDAWATHTLAHVHWARGDAKAGLRFLEETRAHWQAGIWLSVHNGWHLALFLIDLDRGDEVLAKYDAYVEPRLKTNFILDLVDAASLLWRLELAGVDVGARWGAVAAIAAARIGEHVLAFNDLHVALGLAGAGDKPALGRLIDSIDRYRIEGSGDNRAVTDEVGRGVIQGLAAYAAGEYTRAVDILMPVRAAVTRIGGSVAQRAVVDETLLVAAIRAEDWPVARNLLAARAGRLATPRLARLGRLVPGVPVTS